ncbi:MAG: hypothetical protein RLZZ158_603 [Cyanobacteriota bacterium]|jgi:glycosyltransferase involved in cell wall biosynthesis
MTDSVLHLNASAHEGGAARAALRLHNALLANGINSAFQSAHPEAINPWRHWLSRWRYHGFRTAVPGLHTIAWPDTALGRRLMRQPDPRLVLHFHWLGDDLLSIEQLGRLNGPLCWTLHDMWPFCGAEHYTNDSRYSEGYLSTNRPAGESGKDLNRLTWSRKLRSWRRPLQLITPSRWLQGCVRRSALLGDWPCVHIPNAIDHDQWYPLNQEFARQSLGLPMGIPLVLFVAVGGLADPRKGSDLLLQALQLLREKLPVELVLVGGKVPSRLSFPCHDLGFIDDDQHLQLIYAACDLLALPSRLDNLPNTALEAQMCGRPVVAFESSGAAETVEHGFSGALAAGLDPSSFARALWQVLQYPQPQKMSDQCRKRAMQLWSPAVVAKAHANMYQKLLACN